jgi:hypothetical protein
MHSRIGRSITGLLLSLAPAVAMAQPRGTPGDAQEPIPRELALALLNLGPGMAGGGGDILIGKVPEDVPPELVPAGLQVLGSSTQFENRVIVLAAPQAPDSSIAMYEANLLRSGWTKPPTPQQRPMRGFVSADVGQGVYEPPDIVCRGDSFVMFSASYRRTTGSLLKITYNRGSRYSMCKMRQDETVYRSPFEEAPVPLLRAPFGAITNDGGGGMSASSQTSFTLSTRLSTRLKVAEVVTHYDKQMRDQGWTSIAEGALPFIAGHTYRKNDDKGRTWAGTLFSLMLPDSLQQSVTLQLTRAQAPVAK